MTQQRGRRRGDVFSVRITDEERERLQSYQRAGGGPRALGPWLLWRALDAGPVSSCGSTPPAPAIERVLPTRADFAPRPDVDEVVPAQRAADPPPGARLILDLCGGSGSWSRPYAEAGYRVELVTLPDHDVRTYVPPADVWGVLAAPPCTEFSLARNGTRSLRQGRAVITRPRDFIIGMETVNACMRIILQARPRWWALENPTGHLGEFLGAPRDVWEPCDFGDPWTKRTALWGDFTIPTRGPFVEPLGGGPFCTRCDPERRRTSWCSNAAHRAETPPGFARAFFEANP